MEPVSIPVLHCTTYDIYICYDDPPLDDVVVMIVVYNKVRVWN